GDARGRDDARGHRQAERVRGVIDVALRAACSDPDGPGSGVDPPTPHHREVDDETIVDTGEPRPIVAAAADRDPEIVIPAEIYRSHDIGDIEAARDHGWPFVDHAVVEPAGLVIIGIEGLDQCPAKAVAQLGSALLLHGILLWGHPAQWRSLPKLRASPHHPID